jgi:hypothetical protein
VEFQGIVVEVPELDEKGKPVLNAGTKKNPIDPPEQVFVPVAPETLPDMAESIAGIVAIEPDVSKLKFIFAKAYNAVAFTLQVAATTIAVESILDPLFVEFGITDEASISTQKRAITSMANQTGLDPVVVCRMLLTAAAKK